MVVYIEYREFTDSPDYDDYYEFRFTGVMSEIWGAKTQPYLNWNQVATIGTGFNLKTSLDNFKIVAQEILGGDYTDGTATGLWNIAKKNWANGNDNQLRNQLNTYLSNHGINQQFKFDSIAEIKDVLATLGTDHEGELDSWGDSGIPYSKERAVLFSIMFEGVSTAGPLGDILTGLVFDADRDAAWFGIRYDLNDGDSARVAARRYLQSDTFELYNDPTSVGYEEAFQVVRQYQSSRNKVLAYEHKFDPEASGQNAAHPHPAAGNGGNINDQLQPAIAAVAKNFDLTIGHVEEVLFTSNLARGVADLRGDGTNFDSNKNDDDLLIGDSRANKLSGEQGHDVLVGLSGNDDLFGGFGNDDLYGGNGLDNLVGGGGNDRLVGAGGKDRLEGGAGNDTYVLMTDNAGPDTDPDPDPDPSLVGSGNDDLIVEAANGGLDTVILGVYGTYNIKNVEKFRLAGPVTGNVAMVLNQFDSFRLSDGDDTLTLTINKLQKDAIEIITGAGADTLRVKLAAGVDPSQVLDHKGLTARFHLTDLSAQDTIDLTSIGIKKIVTNDLDISDDKGFYLMAPGAQIHLMHGGHEDKTYNNDTNSWFVVKCGDDTPYGPEFYGHVVKDNFDI